MGQMFERVIIFGLSMVVFVVVCRFLYNCPVLMNKVDYNCVAAYMVQKTGEQDKLMSKGTYCGIRSAIIYLYTMSDLSPPRSLSRLSV